MTQASLPAAAGLLKEALSDAKHTKVLIDGFPRVLDQLKEFEKQVCSMC
jgi:adenylate kinase family enzyme